MFVCLFVCLSQDDLTAPAKVKTHYQRSFVFIFLQVFLSFVVVYKASFLCWFFSPICCCPSEMLFFLFYLFYVLNKCLVQVPTSLCSPECPAGYIKKRNGIYECCFDCEICANGTYVNITGNGSQRD